MKKQSSANLAVDTAHYDKGIVKMMDEATHCLCCGKYLRYIANKDKRRNRGYCCLQHYYAKPPKMVYAEREYGRPVREVILEFLNTGHTVQATANLMGIEKPNFYEWLKKLGIKRSVIWT